MGAPARHDDHSPHGRQADGCVIYRYGSDGLYALLGGAVAGGGGGGGVVLVGPVNQQAPPPLLGLI